MKRLSCRFVLTGLSLSVLVAGLALYLSRSETIQFDASTPVGLMSVAVMNQGWMFHYTNVFGQFDANVLRHPNGPIPWHESLKDVSPTWITPALVVCQWTAHRQSFLLIGVKHYLVFPALMMATLGFAIWFRRRFPTGSEVDE